MHIFDDKANAEICDHSLQGSETRKNRFLTGRMEETGKKVFLPQVPVSSGIKLEKTLRNT